MTTVEAELGEKENNTEGVMERAGGGGEWVRGLSGLKGRGW